MTTSIIIPSFNSNHTIGYLLENLDYENSSLLEVIIADSSPEEEYKKLCELTENYPKIKVLNLGKKSIPAIARNRGAEAASGELLVFIDSDAYPDKNWLNGIQDMYNSGISVGGGGIALPDFQENNSIAVSQYYLQFNEYIPVGDKRKKDFAPSCNLFCEKALFFKIGGFPEIRASEDVLFGLKVNQEKPFWFLPDIKVFHVFGEGSIRMKNNQKLLGKYNAIYRKQQKKGKFNSLSLHILLFPFLPLIKLGLLTPRIARAGKSHFRSYLKHSQYVFLGLIYWSLGYMSGYFSNEESVNGQC